jgi:hypothetical protein
MLVSVHLGDDHLRVEGRVASDGFTQLFVFRCEMLAMTAPRRIELNQCGL